MRSIRHASAFVLTLGFVGAVLLACVKDENAGEAPLAIAPPTTALAADAEQPDALEPLKTDGGDGGDAEAGPKAPFCGDFIVNGTEKCDFGSELNTGGYRGCKPDCTLGPHCGDGLPYPFFEECDEGAANGSLNACSPVCKRTNLLLWLEAQDPSGNGMLPADNTPLASWFDKARGRAVVQPTASQQPLWRSAGVKAKPSFQFDGVDDLFDVDLDINGAVLPDITVVVVFQNDTTNPAGQAFAGLWGHDDGGWDRFMGTGGTSGLTGISDGTFFTPVTGLTAESVPLIVTTTYRSDLPNMSTVHVNGVLSATFTGSINPGTTRMSIGNINGPSIYLDTHAFDGLIAEMRIYGEALTDANRIALETILKARYL